MSDQYVGEIRQVGFNFAPPGWLACDGSLVAISDYDMLYALIGTTYGGDGQQTFALPDLRGRSALGVGTGLGLPTYALGQSSGTETVTLTTQQLPLHTHVISAQNDPTASNQTSPGSGYFGNSQGMNQYAASSGSAVTAPVLLPVGGNQPHENRMPYLASNFIIATQGNYPSAS